MIARMSIEHSDMNFHVLASHHMGQRTSIEFLGKRWLVMNAYYGSHAGKVDLQEWVGP